MSAPEDNTEFKASSLTQIPFLSVEELNTLENDISNEFKKLSKNYLSSRLSRINHKLEQLNQQVKNFNENDKNWLKIYNFEIETIKNIKTNTEDLILLNSGLLENKSDIIESLDEYEEELKEIFNNLQSPLEFDDFLNSESSENKTNRLPFESQFNNIIKPFKNDLNSIINEKNYQNNLINSNSKGNSTIVWKQYYQNLLNYRDHLTNKTYSELNELYKEYYQINTNEINNTNWKHYYRSLISPSNLKRSYDELNKDSAISNNHDINYSTDNFYYQKNKVELTNAKQEHLKNLSRFEISQQRDISNKKIKLNSCLGLTDSEIDDDLFLLRNKITSKNKEPINTTENNFPREKEQEQQQSYEGVGATNNIHNDRSENMEDDEETLKLKYKQLLGINTITSMVLPELASSLPQTADSSTSFLRPKSSPIFNIPDLPPLDKFPQLKTT